ncbi:signal transduction histidine kinase [Kribbella orskensis]|uniref:histidine kinase n=1 Tax=Kribbella orskensis TaxID=2512216 RepID=A0ABY2BX30_9ACTN|nr:MULTISPECIES: histidine kinase [Kribbella]TCN44203.1 signal transduction histidine kinase [Kribbella sp. VKM Ac-2500]TCO32019.1 signal transduction histidine kinase [Kribbella orskensis]
MQARAASLHLPAFALDLLIALFITVMQVQGTLAKVAADPESVLRPLADLGHLGYILLIASGVVVVLRRQFPVAVVAIIALTSLIYYTLDFPDGPGWLGLFVALYTLTAYGDGRWSLAIAGAVIAVLAVDWLVAAANVEPRAAIGWVFFRIGASVMSAALGESVRTRRVIAADALERAELAERTREEEARARVDEERLRIAREVHDTVAHAIAIINVQSGVTAHLFDKRPERTREALEAIEKTSSQALREMRSILGVLRDAHDGRVPHPGLGQIDELIAQARHAGLDIKLESAPATEALPSAVDSAAYRILQESITNVIRHVGSTRVTIRLVYGVDSLELCVTNERGDTSHDGGTSAVPGRGITGMRERCSLLGGDLDAGPRADGGFAVSARLPFAPVGGAGH